MAKSSLKTRLTLALASVGFLIVLIGGFALYSLDNIETLLEDIFDNQVTPMMQLRNVHKAYAVTIIDQPQNAEHGTVLAAEARRLISEEFAKAEKEWQGYMATGHSAREKVLIEEAKASHATASEAAQKAVAILSAGQTDALKTFNQAELHQKVDPFTEKLDILLDEQKTEVAAAIRNEKQAYQRMLWLLLGSVLAGLFVVGWVGFSLRRMAGDLGDLISEVKESGLQVNSSVMEIAATAKEQQATASEVAATTAEIGATSKEISATSKELLKTVNNVTQVAEQTAGFAGEGQVGLQQMEQTMTEVIQASTVVNSKLAVVNEKASNINQVVTTINKIADQTNLLSLNAAIEAEKAGEYGRGFSVVALEIRRLADQTAVATYDIEQIVKEMQTAVSAGVMGMDKFSEEVRRGVADMQQVSTQLAQIIQQVQVLTPQFETVQEGMQSQATGAQQISEALSQLTEAAQQSVDSLRQSNQAIDQLNQVSAALKKRVGDISV